MFYCMVNNPAIELIFCRLNKGIKFNYAAVNQEFLLKLSLAKPATSAGVCLFSEPWDLIKL